MKTNLPTLITMVVPGKATQKALMMANSLRTFGGSLQDSPIWFLVPSGMEHFSEPTQQEIASLDIQIHPFRVTPELIQFPFAAKVMAAAQGENIARTLTESLVWLDTDNIILRQPNELCLPAGKSLAYRPVHHKLIGLPWDGPLDAFWELLFRSCHVPAERLFPMLTHTGERIKPYFNAGTFVTNPTNGLLKLWRDIFLDLYQKMELKAWYQTNELYAIFIHQAIFTGVILQALSLEEIHELSPWINYPLHLHHEIPSEIRAASLRELTTLRYENIFDTPDWRSDLPILVPLTTWLDHQPLVHSPQKG